MESTERTFVEKVKSELNIRAVIEKTVPLRKESDEWWTGATSTESKSGASLKVNVREQWYKNFATGDGGDVLSWIAYANNLDIKKDFTQILQTAAEYAGIPYEGASAESQARAEEVQAVQAALTQAAEIYYSNLTPEIREYIHKKWGINDNTIDALKIGYARPSINLIDKINSDVLKRTGLVVKVSDDCKEHFIGRITFPYWNNGKVVNFAARGDKEFLETPDSPFEQAKYKKLLVHSDKHSYVSPVVNNRYLFGEDTVRKQTYCIITEGIADAVVLIQNGYPVLSPVTVSFADKDIPQLINAAKHFSTVYICNDNETSGAGEKGAVKTAVLLKNEGVAVKIVTLPRENLDKMDVAEYFLRHTKAEFEEVKEQSQDILVHLLNKIQPSKCPDVTAAKTENVKKALEFTKNVLKSIKDEEEVSLFIRNNIKSYFPKFTGEETKALIKAYKNAVIDDSNKDPSQDSKMVFDLDSESGRSTMTQVLTKEIMQHQHIKYIAGALHVYSEGVYSSDSEVLMNLQRDVIELAAVQHRTPIVTKHAENVTKLLEVKTVTRLNECRHDVNEIALGNGILNLQTFELLPFTPEKVFFSKVPVNYNPDAAEPVMFNHFIDSVFKNNEEQKKVIQELFGYCLMDTYKYQCIFYLIGDGGNGKGTLLQVLTNLLGKENTASATLLQLTDHNNVEYYLASLHGKKANLCGDIGKKPVENTENLKKLSSNTDVISARLPYGKPFEFINSAKLVFAMNKAPEKNSFSTGDKRRDILIDFLNPFSETTEEIKNLTDKIKDAGEMSGVLNWALEGLKRLERKQEFSYTKSTARKGQLYDMKSKPLKYFVQDCIEGPEWDEIKHENKVRHEVRQNFLPTEDVYQAYTKYRKEKCLPELSQEEIKKGVIDYCKEDGINTYIKRRYVTKKRGDEEIKDVKTTGFVGIQLAEAYEAKEEFQQPGQTTLSTKTEEKRQANESHTQQGFNACFKDEARKAFIVN